MGSLRNVVLERTMPDQADRRAWLGKCNVYDDVKLISESASVYLLLGAVHRLENPGKVPLHLIEVQTGAYLGGDDIMRYEDIYARDKAA